MPAATDRAARRSLTSPKRTTEGLLSSYQPPESSLTLRVGVADSRPVIYE